MSDTTHLGLPCIEGPEAEFHVTHNEALRMLDALVQLAVLDRDLSAPPGSPSEGQRWIVGASPTGAWAGRAGHIAAWQDGAWAFFAPRPGWIAYIADEALLVVWDGAAWQGAGGGGGATELQNLTRLGVGTTADATNPFAAKLNNALWVARTTGEGGSGDIRYKISKEAAANTLSLLFQTNFSGRAEIGLAGDDDLHVKVSPDGTSWTEALIVDRNTGDVDVGGFRVGRDAVINALPDSGRFNGNANNIQFNGIAYSAPTYLSAASGAAIAAHAKFVHDNSTYGGAGSALDAEVNALISKIRPNASDRRYGPEWYVLLITQTTGSLSEAQNIGGTNYGLAFTNTFTALPRKYTAGFYVKVKTGSAAIVVPAASKGRAYLDGVLYPGGSAPVVLQNADGWKYVNLQSGPNQFFYNYRAFDVILPAGAQIYFAMPRFVFGHVAIDPNLGVLMNDKMFG